MKTIVERTVAPSFAGAQKFHLDCLPFIFSNEELEILEKKGHVMKALSEGKQHPDNSEERSFVKVCKGQVNARTTMETAWIKYLHRHQIEASLFYNEELYQEYLRVRR